MPYRVRGTACHNRATLCHGINSENEDVFLLKRARKFRRSRQRFCLDLWVGVENSLGLYMRRCPVERAVQKRWFLGGKHSLANASGCLAAECGEHADQQQFAPRRAFFEGSRPWKPIWTLNPKRLKKGIAKLGDCGRKGGEA